MLHRLAGSYRMAEVLKERGGLVNDHPDAVATTWSLSFQCVEEKNAAAADLLRFCAFLAPDAIPEEIITAGAEHLGPLLQVAVNDPITLNKTIAALGAYSLIRRDPAKKTLSIHRLVQAVLRDAMTDEEAKLWAERTVLAVSKACLSLNNLAELYRSQGKYGQAEPLYVRALEIREQELGADQPDTASSLNNLAWLYESQGKYSEAEPLYVRALEICEQELGADHPSTVRSLNNLAGLYERQGKYGQAEPLLKRALAICEKALGSQHPNTQLARKNYAKLLRAMGCNEEAK